MIFLLLLIGIENSIAQNNIADYYRADYEGKDRDQQKSSDMSGMRGPDYKHFQDIITADGKKSTIQKKIQIQTGMNYGCPAISNPAMEKQEWLNLIQSAESLVNKKFSDSLALSPNFKKRLNEDLEVLKQDPTCMNSKNDCRLRLQATLEYYTDFLSPNMPDPFLGFDPKKSKMKDAAIIEQKYHDYKQSLVVYSKALDLYNKTMNTKSPDGMKPSTNFDDYIRVAHEQVFFENSSTAYLISKAQPKSNGKKKEEEPQTNPTFWNMHFSQDELNLISPSSSKRNELIQADVAASIEEVKKDKELKNRLAGTLKLELIGVKNALKTAQSILIDEKNQFENDLGAIIEPRKGATGKNPCNITVHQPRVWDKFNSENFMTSDLNIPPPPPLPCVEKIDVIDEQDLKVTFKPGDYLLDATQSKAIQDQLNEIVSAKQAEGFTVTGYKIVASASYPYGKLSSGDAYAKNTDLANNRAKSAKTALAGVTTLSQAESKEPDVGVYGPKVSLDKYGSDNTKLKDKPVDPNNDQEVKELYDYLKPYFDERKMFPTQDDYKKYLVEQKITSAFDATFKAFQAFKVVVYGKKSTEKPCNAESDTGIKKIQTETGSANQE